MTPAPRSSFLLEPALRALQGRQSLLIYMHDNPDPDALAAAVGLRRLIEHELPTRATLALGGIVGRAENRAMVEALGITMTPVENLDSRHFEALAIVDSQPGTGNNSLPTDRQVDVVIDHHPPRQESARAGWCDIQPELGATSTIVLQYLLERNIELDPPLATALFYALRTETRDLGREATDAERAAYLHLVPLVDHSLLFRVSHPKKTTQYFTALDQALRSAQVRGNLVVSNLGSLAYPDLVAEIADLLLSLDGAEYVFCCGRFGTRVYMSLRTEASRGGAGTMIREVIGHEGAAGGHGTMAGGRLHRPISNDADLAGAFNEIVTRLTALIGRSEALPFPLVSR